MPRDGPTRCVRVLVVDDPAPAPSLLGQLIDREPDLRVVGMAPDPVAARGLIRTLAPDVIVVDVDAVRMESLDVLASSVAKGGAAVIAVAADATPGSGAALRAARLGSPDLVARPSPGVGASLDGFGREVARRIRAAAAARLPRPAPRLDESPALSADAILASDLHGVPGPEPVLAVGASTGGTEAIKVVLAALPPGCPGVVVTQHMPESFTRAFAARLDALCRIRVKQAEAGERVLPGHAYVAPGHSHLLLERSGAAYVARLSDGPPVNRHRPSVDVLFRSVANAAGRNAVGILLTGMGRDGAAGLLEMKRAGAWTIAQDEASCVVYGMPREAVALGAAAEVAPLGMIAGRALERFGRERAVRA